MVQIAATVARFALATAALFAGAAANAGVYASVEAAGRQYSSVNFTYGGVEEFDAVAAAPSSYNSTFSGSDIRATLTGFTTAAANAYGGAGGNGRYALAGDPAVVAFTSGPVVNYLGLWVSALDGANSIAFYSRGTQLASYNLVTMLNSVANAAAYRGNPTNAYRGQIGDQSFAFINFFSDSAFDRVELTRNGGGGFELDNLTVGFAGAGAVPEPATWATMLLGFGLVGSVARRRRARRLLPAAC